MKSPHLISQSVERASQSGHSGREGEVGIGQSGADQMRGVRRHVAALVVRVDHQVQTHQL